MDSSPLFGDSVAPEQPCSSNSIITDSAVPRKRFGLAQSHVERIASQPAMNTNTDHQVTLAYLLQSQREMRDEVMTTLRRLEFKVDKLEKALAEKMPERAEVQAQGQLLRECKVVTSKVHQSIARITGDVISEEHTLLQSMLPLSSQEQLNILEELLGNKPHLEAMLNIILKLKASKGCIKHVFRRIFADPLLLHYNYEGKAKKAPLLGLKIMELVFDAFGSMPKSELIAEIRKHVSLSHNRYKQVVMKNKR